MHVGALVIFEGPPPAREEFLRSIESRLQLRAALPAEARLPAARDGPAVLGRRPELQPRLPRAPHGAAEAGLDEQLRELAGRIFSQRLDRSKPLWELWIVQGLEGGRFALISKTHHALVDGVSGVDIATVLFDLSPVPDERRGRGRLDARARALRRGAGGRGRQGPRRSTPFSLAGRAIGALQRPGPDARARARGRRGARRGGLGGHEPGARTCRSTCRSARTGACCWVQSRLADFKAIKNALGGTVNDAFLAVVAGALAALAARPRRAHRGPRAARARAGLDPRARTSAARSATGSPRCAGRCPSTRTTRSSGCGSCSEAMGELKESKQALGAEVIAGLHGLRAAHAARPGVAAQLLHPPLQPDRHERAGAAVPALPARARDAGDRADRVPARGPRARRGDHELQRQGRLRPARRLRRDARPRARSPRTSRSRSRSCSPPPAAPGKASARSNGRKKDGTPGTARKKTTTS